MKVDRNGIIPSPEIKPGDVSELSSDSEYEDLLESGESEESLPDLTDLRDEERDVYCDKVFSASKRVMLRDTVEKCVSCIYYLINKEKAKAEAALETINLVTEVLTTNKKRNEVESKAIELNLNRRYNSVPPTKEEGVVKSLYILQKIQTGDREVLNDRCIVYKREFEEKPNTSKLLAKEIAETGLAWALNDIFSNHAEFSQYKEIYKAKFPAFKNCSVASR